MNRYSTPKCKPLGKYGNFCLHENEPEDMILSLPNGKETYARGIYRLFCPCAEPMTCFRNGSFQKNSVSFQDFLEITEESLLVEATGNIADSSFSFGLQRYSIPECTPKGRLGDFCREGAEPETKILLYPNMRYLYLEKVWFEVAPCEDNLICFENVCA
ncbi:hypothetical protein CDAR_545951 [Caerostris darwini]|uniref:Uncharacterized protein n=1 Tax=Caerostris darwini TaxID=1538125 RepID=A0AAV4X575_9ARAC|nr:hypothetical protein CDAR_545951 [Caerostris darwini]